MKFEEYQAEVKKHLTERRFVHSQCVAEEAARLALRYGADEEKARLSGILHDIMKDTPKEEQLKIIEQSGILLSKAQRENPRVWHGLAGAVWVKEKLFVTDPAILGAIACHTAGKGGMTLLEKVLFVADYISADRDYPGVEAMREAANRSLEEAIAEGLAFTLGELTSQRLPIAEESVTAYNDAIFILNGTKENEE